MSQTASALPDIRGAAIACIHHRVTAPSKRRQQMSGDSTAWRPSRGEQPRTQGGRPRSRRMHQGPKGASVMDLIFKIRGGDRWSATLRSAPSVVLVSDSSATLTEISRELVLAIFQDCGEETLQALREAGLALPDPDPEPADQDPHGNERVQDAASRL
jgi:hypothetical protein